MSEFHVGQSERSGTEDSVGSESAQSVPMETSELDSNIDGISSEISTLVAKNQATSENMDEEMRRIAELLGKPDSGEHFEELSKKQLLAEFIASYQRLYKDQTYDALTSLLRLEPFLQRMEDILEKSVKVETGLIKRARGQGALAFVDLNGMKDMNKEIGYLATNEVIKEFARRLQVDERSPIKRKSMREHDLIMRFGGDEFILYLHNADPKRVGPAIIQRVTQSLEDDPINVLCFDGVERDVPVSFAVGVEALGKPSDKEAHKLTHLEYVKNLITRAGEQEQLAKDKTGHKTTVLSYKSDSGTNVVLTAEALKSNGRK